MSGLSYNMLKSLSDKAVEYFHACLIQFWLSDRVSASWKWRWLRTIPKSSVENPRTADLRPLMLSEALCKIMSTNVVHKILKVFYETKVLDRSHHGYLAGRGTRQVTPWIPSGSRNWNCINVRHQLSQRCRGEANDL